MHGWGTGTCRTPCRKAPGALHPASLHTLAMDADAPVCPGPVLHRADRDQTFEYTRYRNSANTRANPRTNRPATIRTVLSVPWVLDLLDEPLLRRLSLRLPGCQRLYTATLLAYEDSPSASATSSATSEGFVAALMPAARSASLFASAVLSPPETIAPAWPIVLPSGAVKPAM